jgi:glycosyltransferase involved in cell wall biosynthesis
MHEALDALHQRIRRRVALLGLADGETVRTLYGRVRVAAFPTRYAVPVASGTVMEAVAGGTPIVGSSRLSWDVLVNGVNGLVVETASEPIAVAFRALLNDDALWARLSAGARRMAKQFDALRVAQRYVELAGLGARPNDEERGSAAEARPVS